MAINKNMSTLVSRVLVKTFPFLKSFKTCLGRHIQHHYTQEMSQVSEVVPLGVSLTKYEDLMEELHEYVPTVTTTATLDVTDEEETDVTYDDFHHILVAGDLLTAARARGGQRIRKCGQRPKDRLEGLLPVCEDWHAKVCLLGIIQGWFVKDNGTLYQLRNLINRRNVTAKPDKNVAAAEEFFLTTVEAHIVTAAMELFEMKTVKDSPSAVYFPDGCVDLGSLQKKKILDLACSSLVDRFVQIWLTDSLGSDSPASQHGSDSPACQQGADSPADTSIKAPDLVNGYASNLRLLLMEFNDGIREGDGDRIIRCWRYFLPLFKLEKRTNYSVEAFNLLAQHEFLFTPRMKAQSRTINTHGRVGKNISCDLHMEHLNRDIKTTIAGMGSNVTDQSILRAGKSLKKHVSIQKQFDTENKVPTLSNKHSRRGSEDDRNKIIEQLLSVGVFKTKPGRHHHAFPKFDMDMFDPLPMTDFHSWISAQLQKLLMFT